MMLSVMGACAAFELEMIRLRQAGIAVAKANGVKFGATRKLEDADIRDIQKRMINKQESATTLAKRYGISRQHIYKLLKVEL